MTIVLCGKITGEPDYPKLFENAREQVQMRFPNAKIISPTDIGMDEFTWDECMAVTCALIHGAKNVFMLKNWSESQGARVEHDVAERFGYNIFFEE